MKRLFTAMMLSSAVSLAGAKTLVAYFSCTNNTKNVAKQIAETIGADLYEIEPEVAYTSADLDYNNKTSRTTKEQNEPKARPAIRNKIKNINDYDVVYLGYPIWWGIAPKVIYTFLDSSDFGGKTIIPFCTSGSSGIGSSDTELQKLCPSTTQWKSGHRFASGCSSDTVQKWVKSVQPSKK